MISFQNRHNSYLIVSAFNLIKIYCNLGTFSKTHGTDQPFIQIRLSIPINNLRRPCEEVIIAGSEYLISLIEKCDLGFFDGTFKMAPIGFTQILVLMVLNPETNLFTPILYILATSKTEECYYLTFCGIKIILDKFGLKIKMKIINN